jgi:hypothetical protein
MFVRQNQQQFRNSNADVQIFYGRGSTAAPSYPNTKSWNKPVGVSFVYMMLIGGGGPGSSSGGGGSGGVTVWFGSAQHVPDSLVIAPGDIASDSLVLYRSGGSVSELLSAFGATTTTGAGTPSQNPFMASGFYNLTGGQNGELATPSATTFLKGGYSGTTTTSQYGYNNGTNSFGYFQFQPIIVGVGGSDITGIPQAGTNVSGYGCGGGYLTSGSRGGPGLVLIASW